MNVRKCQASNPLKCSDKYCPSRQKHVLHSRDVLFNFQEEIRTAETDFIDPHYYDALYYELQNVDAAVLKETYAVLDEKLLKVADKINIINRSFLDGYYETGTQTLMSPADNKKLIKLEAEQRKLESQQHDVLVAYYSTFLGNTELKNKIRELKNSYPKPKEELNRYLKFFHEADLQHRKQIIAGLILDGIKAEPTELYSFNNGESLTNGEKKIFNTWLAENPAYVEGKVYGFRNIVDRFGLNVEGEWFTVVPNNDEDNPYLVDVVVPESFPTMFPDIPDLTLFKETTINRMVVLRRLKKRKLADGTQLDLLESLEYNSRKIAELKQL